MKKQNPEIRRFLNQDGTVNSKKLESLVRKVVSELSEESDNIFEEISSMEGLLSGLNYMHIAEANLIEKNGKDFIEKVKNAYTSKDYCILNEYKNKLWLESLALIESISAEGIKPKIRDSRKRYEKLFY